jgi:hypothetical protein
MLQGKAIALPFHSNGCGILEIGRHLREQPP